MFLIKTLSLLPFWFLYAVSEGAALTAYYVFRYRRAVVQSNLKAAFPEMSRKEIFKVEKNFYRHFSQLWVELIKSYRFDKDDWEERMRVTNPEVFLKHLDAGTPVILMSGHTANWEWPAYAVGCQFDYPLDFVYKPVKNQNVNRIMLNIRSKHGARGVTKDSAIRSVIKQRDTPRVIGMISDQLPAIGTEKKWINFLNQITAYYVGTERMGTMAQHPVFYGECIRKKRGHYEITFHELAVPPFEKGIDYKITEKFSKKLEQTIRNSPSEYLWSHKRWKYTPEQEQVELTRIGKLK